MFCERGVQSESGRPNVKSNFLENGRVRFCEKITEGSYGHSLGPFIRNFETKGSLGVKKNKWGFQKLSIRNEA